MSSVLNCSQLSRTFSEGKEALHILRDINLDIAAGERVAIMGTSGSVKAPCCIYSGGWTIQPPVRCLFPVSRSPDWVLRSWVDCAIASSGLFTSFIIYCPSLRR